MKIDWAQVQAHALSGKRITALSDISAVFFFILSDVYSKRYNWVVDDTAPTDGDWDDIEKMIAQAEDEMMKGIIGLILPHALASTANIEVLDCDGATYNRVDYPELYAAINPAFIIDADTFSVPDLRDKFPLGKSATIAIGDTGGESEITLTSAQMPSHTHTTTPHSHTNLPHSHAEGIAVPSAAQVPVVPVPTAIPAAGATAPATITINPETVLVDASGADEAHNNMPPYLAVGWVIVAK